ncbi:quaternary amine ABC transporter ATP-binding protein [Prauserella muralis]|uniref:Glycine betaine ABC transporter ATP-binding protein n=1 Tax=Prauserella muralis TaxID=588067 RepID=A0A2V4AHQ4_9PSEU|nr:glycine betaine/L-proline ABC transporter ATP-binding protein [Prauserella muralis]PXY19409.1 glycine betaine ABC transporter ATP-binding protein [Prauserella muralis]TWE29383.1 glycine betaine/proline transport system ATP-binding protein [Prauserella muralis]
MPTVRAEKLYKVFGRRAREAVRRLEEGAEASELDLPGVTPAVIDASFEVNEGEIFVVMGLSGSGKSTLIRMLNGLLPATSGRVSVDGQDITTMSDRQIREMRQNKMSMVFQHFALFPHRTVLQNAAYGLQIQGLGREERLEKAREALGLVGLNGWEDHVPAQLSGGMRQRVGLARALAADTEVLLMDEAFSALDPLIRREMQDQLLSLQAKLGKTIVFITHDLNEAMRLGDRIAMMRQGRIVQIGTAEEILTHPANDYVAQFVQDVDRTRVLTASSVMNKPAVTIGAGSGPRAALRLMREHQYSALFVVERDGTLAGVITDAAAAEAANQGADTLRGILSQDVAAVGPDTVVSDLFAPSAESVLPLAVLDEDRTLLGVIPRATLLAALGEIGTADPGDAANAKEVAADV